MKEIGGYIELDRYRCEMLYNNALKLNCGRSCLAYLIESKKIRTIWLPYFLCDSVRNICNRYDVNVKFYRIRKDWSIERINILNDEYLYVVNFYGQLDKKYIEDLVHCFKQVIVDNTQAYFQSPICNADTIYTCRKYFGVSDGGLLFTDHKLEREIPIDESYERVRYILGRFERTASEFYKDASANNDYFDNEPIKAMSKLTQNLLSGIDFAYLNEKLTKLNNINVKNVEGAFMYPLMIGNAKKVKQKLLKQKVYIPTLWPNVLTDVPRDWWEYKLANDVLPLPVDQRYGIEDMKYIVNLIIENI